jgi:hypothetical protein
MVLDMSVNPPLVPQHGNILCKYLPTKQESKGERKGWLCTDPSISFLLLVQVARISCTKLHLLPMNLLNLQKTYEMF